PARTPWPWHRIVWHDRRGRFSPTPCFGEPRRRLLRSGASTSPGVDPFITKRPRLTGPFPAAPMVETGPDRVPDTGSMRSGSMTRRLGVLVVFLVLASTGARAGEPIRIRGGACVILIDPTDGSLVVARMAGQAAPMVRGGEHGLWRVEFEDGSSLDGREVSRSGVGRSFEVRHEAGSSRAE